MRKGIVVVIGILLLLSACNKSEKATAGSWKFADVSHAAASATYSAADNSLTATGSDGTLAFFFASQPTQSATYHVVNYTALPLSSDQLYIRLVRDDGRSYYFSTGADNATADVLVRSDGRLNITVSSARLESYANPQSDSAQLVANITQP